MIFETITMHFLTFGAGKTWPLAARRLANQAQSTRLFKSVEFETGDDFFVRHPDFAPDLGPYFAKLARPPR